MEVYLVRHTRVILPPGICYGISDVALADTHEQEIDTVVNQFKKVHNYVVYSSPLIRCKMLAEKLSNNVIYDDRLKEMNFGNWELQKWDSIKGYKAKQWMTDFVNVCCPRGESFVKLSKRVNAFISDLYRSNLSTAIIITHAGVIRSILSVVQGIPLRQSFDYHIAYGEIIKVDI